MPAGDTTTGSVRFVADGPEFPIDLLHAIEDGTLVLFCGAGVSRRCGLPDFKGLVEKLAKALRPLKEDEDELFLAKDYPSALGLLENRIGKQRVRKAIASILEIRDGDLSTHQALLQLATARDGQPRLVTTNSIAHLSCAMAAAESRTPLSCPFPETRGGALYTCMAGVATRTTRNTTTWFSPRQTSGAHT